MLDWIFEGIITWVSSVASKLMDTISGMFLEALGTDMTTMEEYFPYIVNMTAIRSFSFSECCS